MVEEERGKKGVNFSEEEIEREVGKQEGTWLAGQKWERVA